MNSVPLDEPHINLIEVRASSSFAAVTSVLVAVVEMEIERYKSRSPLGRTQL